MMHNPARLARTLGALHPIQWLFRGPQLLSARMIRTVSAQHAPPPFLAPQASEALAHLMKQESVRAKARLRYLPEASLLKQFEQNLGFELFDSPTQAKQWLADYGKGIARVAIHPFPASLRARNLAVAIRQGIAEAHQELSRAARAVLLQPELHLLGNHLLENAFALCCAGAITTGAEADLWWNTGKALLGWQLPIQYLPDGGHFERAVSYHLALLTGLLQCIDLGRTGRGEVPIAWEDTASRALGWALTLQAPDGTYPLFNDSMLDAAPSIRDIEAYARALGIAPITCARSHVQHDRRIHVLADTGWIVMKNRDAWLVFDAGDDGASQQPGHVHADALSFELWVEGNRCVVDYGVSSYLADEERERTRSTRSHNTVELNGQDSCEVWAQFRVGRRQQATIDHVMLDESRCLARAKHTGYAHLKGSPIHARELSLRSDGLGIEDRIEGSVDTAVSRLRVDTSSVSNLRVKGDTEAVRTEGRWHPMYGQARACSVYEFEGRGPTFLSRVNLQWD